MFKLHSTNAPKTPVIEYLLATDNEKIVVGELLKVVSGKLTKASGTDTPEFVSVGQIEAGENITIPVVRIMESDVYETIIDADGTSLNVGDKVTVSEDGLCVTATTTSGVFTITEKLDDGKINTKIRGMFRR